MSDPSQIWIVERSRDGHYGPTKRVVSWHRTLAEAEAMAARLQAEFERASELAWPWHEVISTIWEMLQEHQLAMYAWTDCDAACEGYDRRHQHLSEREGYEHEVAMIVQLRDLWHEESRAWQIFVDTKILPLMTDPPGFCRELVAPLEGDEDTVSYTCHVIGNDPAVARAGYAARAQKEKVIP